MTVMSPSRLLQDASRSAQARMPRVYFARAMDDMDVSHITEQAALLRAELDEHGLEVVDAFFGPQQVDAQSSEVTNSIIHSDLKLLRQCDAVFMDMACNYYCFCPGCRSRKFCDSRGGWTPDHCDVVSFRLSRHGTGTLLTARRANNAMDACYCAKSVH